MAATSSSYQAVTIIALLVAAGLIIFMGIVYTQNQSKWNVVDTVRNALKGPVSVLGIGNPNPGSAASSQSFLVSSVGGEEQFSGYVITDASNKPIMTWRGKNGIAQTALVLPPQV